MYIVEGNIGAGKSTFITLLHSYLPHITYSLEPVDTWARQNYGKSLLEQFYTDPHRWAYTIETLAMLCRSRDYMKSETRSSFHFMERSLYSGHYCFALNGKAEGYFNPLEWEIYQQWVDFIFSTKSAPPSGFIYLQAAPTVCSTRIAKRSRNGEAGIPLDYLEKIHHWHEEFLIGKVGIAPDIARVPVLVLDVNQDFANTPARMAELAQKVAHFMAETEPATIHKKNILTCGAN